MLFSFFLFSWSQGCAAIPVLSGLVLFFYMTSHVQIVHFQDVLGLNNLKQIDWILVFSQQGAVGQKNTCQNKFTENRNHTEEHCYLI